MQATSSSSSSSSFVCLSPSLFFFFFVSSSCSVRLAPGCSTAQPLSLRSSKIDDEDDDGRSLQRPAIPFPPVDPSPSPGRSSVSLSLAGQDAGGLGRANGRPAAARGGPGRALSFRNWRAKGAARLILKHGGERRKRS